MHARLIFAMLPLLWSASVMATDRLPYDVNANARQDLIQAEHIARQQHKPLLLIFGANWCKDCRVLDATLHSDRLSSLLKTNFVVVNIDVGEWNKNLDLAAVYGNPIKRGIPAVVVTTADNEMLYASAGGELADARGMGEAAVYQFFQNLVSQSTK